MKSKIESIETLKKVGVRPTANRILVLETLINAERPLSLLEIVDELVTLDKSSVSRCLTQFKKHHLVHVIEDGSNSVKYESCNSRSQHTDEDLHAHFYCEKCCRTFCFSKIHIPDVKLPQGYTVTSINYVLKGVCADCCK